MASIICDPVTVPTSPGGHINNVPFIEVEVDTAFATVHLMV